MHSSTLKDAQSLVKYDYHQMFFHVFEYRFFSGYLRAFRTSPCIVNLYDFELFISYGEGTYIEDLKASNI